MSKKEELIKKILYGTDDQGNDYCKDDDWDWSRIYDEIRASILTPKVVALLKAIGSRPSGCDNCDHLEKALFGEPLICKLNCIEYADCYNRCHLLTAEELKELTE